MSEDQSISVVMPLFNKERRVAFALSSLLNQTVQPREVIVVNDGSTDASVQVVQEFLPYFKVPIRVLSISNSGVSAARNLGVEKALSRFIGFLDADDEWSSQFIERMTALIGEFPDAALYGCAHLRQRNAGESCITVRASLAEGYRGYVPDFFSASLRGGIANSSKVVVSKDALRTIGGFPVSARAGEDLYVWMRLATSRRCVYDDFVGATITQELDLSRGCRNEAVSFPLTYYGESKVARDELPASGMRFLRRVFLTHFFSALARGDRSCARAYLISAKRIFGGVGLLYPLLLVPSFFYRRLKEVTALFRGGEMSVSSLPSKR